MQIAKEREISLNSFFGGQYVSNLDSKSFEEKFNSTKNALLIDVRTLEEHLQARIPNSILIDIYQPDFFERIEQLDKAKTYFVYCRSGSRSYMACQQMQKMGFRNVHNLRDGIIEWEGKIENG